MKITNVEALYLRQPEVKHQCDSGQDVVVVRISTDAGISGIGEVDSAPLAVKGMIEGGFSHTITSGLRELLLGEDPLQTQYLWHKMYEKNIYSGRRGIAIHAMSGIDMALWDIKGKFFQQPIWKLLGGGFHQKVRAYASSLFAPTPQETAERAVRFRDLGFTAVKFGWQPMGESEQNDIDLVRAARAGLGDDIDLMIDAGLVWDAKTAIQRARAFSDFRIFWLEEPLHPDDYEGYRKLSQATEVRIAAGEEESERRSFVELMDKGQIDIVQVDLARCGGFTEAVKIASLAQDRGLPVVNHGFTTFINVAAALHFVNAIPNSFILEFVAEESTHLRNILTHQKFVAKDGYLDIPQEPGLGVELNEEAAEQFLVRVL
jgi:L-alanine-DL-glutamate epimerase-like enolase superfamily enzyme